MQIRWLAVAAVLIAAYGAGLYYEQNFATAGCCGLTWPTSDPYQAERILAAVDSVGVNAADQQRAAVAVLGARPGDPTGWLRLSLADWLAHKGRMTDAGKRAFDTSYLITPYGGTFTPWRVALALNNWSALSHDARVRVAEEIQLVKGDQYLAATKRAARHVRDPSGRLAAAVLGILPVEDIGKPAS